MVLPGGICVPKKAVELDRRQYGSTTPSKESSEPTGGQSSVSSERFNYNENRTWYHPGEGDAVKQAIAEHLVAALDVCPRPKYKVYFHGSIGPDDADASVSTEGKAFVCLSADTPRLPELPPKKWGRVAGWFFRAYRWLGKRKLEADRLPPIPFTMPKELPKIEAEVAPVEVPVDQGTRKSEDESRGLPSEEKKPSLEDTQVIHIRPGSRPSSRRCVIRDHSDRVDAISEARAAQIRAEAEAAAERAKQKGSTPRPSYHHNDDHEQYFGL
jgi:hypothetical protein